jgi:hypothetical protein
MRLTKCLIIALPWLIREAGKRRWLAPLWAPAVLASHTLLQVEHQRDEWRGWLTAAGVAPDGTRG